VKPGDRFRAQNGSIVKVMEVDGWKRPAVYVTYTYEFDSTTKWERTERAFLSRFTPIEPSP
jgi:hypothetical protein